MEHALKHVPDEISHSEIYEINEITNLKQLRREEVGSLPWRSSERWNEPGIFVEEILKGVGK